MKSLKSYTKAQLIEALISLGTLIHGEGDDYDEGEKIAKRELYILNRKPDTSPRVMSMPFKSDEPKVGDSDPKDADYCEACGKMVKDGTGCWIHIHNGGASIVRDGADLDALGGESADLNFWRLGPSCKKKVPLEFRYQKPEHGSQ